MTDSNKPYDILVFREYKNSNGEVKTASRVAGVAFKTKSGDGYACTVDEGLALTGRFSILPRKERTDAAETEE